MVATDTDGEAEGRTMRLKGHLFACLAFLSIGGGPAPDEKPAYLAGSLPDDAPRPVYTPDPSDPWNRIFNLLFTRTVRFQLAGEFAGADAPLERVRISGFPDLPVSRGVFERIEGGDRGIEPLDPFPIHIGGLGTPTGVLDDPRFGRFRQALDEALGESSDRLPPAPMRAVMQADLWAVHDLLIAARPRDEAGPARKEELLGRLARLVRKLALSRREIEGLPDNYAEAGLPFDLFADDGGWVEVEYHPGRFHDRLANDRKAARVFLKPSSPPGDRDAWLNGLRAHDAHGIEKFDAVALVVQLLAVDADGVVVPTRLAYEVQVRSFPRKEGGEASAAKLTVAELSREAMRLDPRGGGLRAIEEREPSYLPRAGNDYSFPMSRPGRTESVLAPLRMRCQACHGEKLGVMMTFAFHDPNPPPVRALVKARNEHGQAVALRKMERPDFLELKRRWDR